MQIIEHTKPKLPKIKMLCDDVIDEKLTQHEAIKVCFSKSSTTLVAGGTGSGKTTWVLQMLKGVFKKCFHEIILVMPQNSFASINPKDNPFLHIDPENIYHELNVDVLSEIYAKLEESSAEGHYTLLIIDDFGAALKEKPIEFVLNRVFTTQRHLRVSVFLLIQNYYQPSKRLREVATNLIMHNSSRSQNLKMLKEQFNITENQFSQLLKLMPTTHDYCILNLKYKKIFNNWNEVVFES